MAIAFAMSAKADVVFIGTDGNWFNPSNWSSGQVPDAATDVRLDGNADVFIDPAQGSPNIAVHDLTIAGTSQLRTLPGTILNANALRITEGGLLDAKSSQIFSDSLDVDPALLGGFSLNPTTSDSRDIKINANNPAKMTFGLGGLLAAGPGNVGLGHYATLRGDDIELSIPLELQLLYGFTPTPGDVFTIVEARNSFDGMFTGLPEGSLAGSFDDVGLFISYLGGDGNDVTLTAASIPEPTSLSLLLLGAVLLRRR